jgi:hypothetical protein
MEGGHMFDRLVEGLLKERQALVEEARTKAETETRAQEREEADKKAYNDKLESARKLKARGNSDEDIADILSLPVQDVAAL